MVKDFFRGLLKNRDNLQMDQSVILFIEVNKKKLDKPYSRDYIKICIDITMECVNMLLIAHVHSTEHILHVIRK